MTAMLMAARVSAFLRSRSPVFSCMGCTIHHLAVDCKFAGLCTIREARSGVARLAQRFPRRACSSSIASNSALKLPTPKPREPWRSMISKKNVGRSWIGRVKIWRR